MTPKNARPPELVTPATKGISAAERPANTAVAAAAQPVATMPIADIRVDERIRRDMGDIQGLAESIEDIGLLHPITVDETGLLLAGARRLAACKSLGWDEIAVRTVGGSQ